MTLKELGDQKVDVYKENARFDNLLAEFYKTRDESIFQECSAIIFRCSMNVLKRKYGSWYDADWILNKAIEITDIICTRIKNFEKWPNGYQIKNLPTVVKYAVWNAVCGRKAFLKDTSELEWNDDVNDAVNYRVVDAYEIAYYNNCSWEDECISRVDEEMGRKDY